MKKLFLVLILLITFSVNESFAQFEGKVMIDNYSYNSSGQKKDDDTFTMYVTPERILLKGNDSYKVGGTLKADGILVRMKEQDFVFMTGSHQAMKISKSGISSFMNMFGDDARGQQATSGISVKKTGDTKQINGYSCDKFMMSDSNQPDKKVEIWMTKGLNINWGMLGESWGSKKLSGFTGSNVPFSLIFDNGYFPMMWKQYEGDKMTNSGQARVEKTAVAQSKVQIPSGVKVINLQSYLFQQMRKQQ